MMRLDMPVFRLAGAELLILKTHYAVFPNTLGQDFERFQVRVLRRERAKRDRLVQASQGEGRRTVELTCQLLKGRLQRLFEWRAVILGDGLVRYQQSENFRFRH